MPHLIRSMTIVGVGCFGLILTIIQVSIYCGSWFLSALAGRSWNDWIGFLCGTVALSGFFTFEVCRKLDPMLPKVLYILNQTSRERLYTCSTLLSQINRFFYVS